MLNSDETESRLAGALELERLSRRGFLTAAAGAAAFGALFVSQSSATPAIAAVTFPLYNPYTAHYLRSTFATHGGAGGALDYDFGTVGTPVLAPAAGTVIATPGNSTTGLGHYIKITHPGGYYSILGHLSAFTVTSGSVAMGAEVGRSGGDPGTPGAGAATGKHLHWEMHDSNGARIDPLLQVNCSAPTTSMSSRNNEEEDIIRYIYCVRSGVEEYGIFGIGVPGGRYTTTSVPEAEALGVVYGTNGETDGIGIHNGAPWRKVTPAQFDVAKTLFATLRAAHLAELKA